MKLSVLVEKLNLRVWCGTESLEREVLGGYVGDLLSDVIANSKKGDVWITRQAHQNIVAVATLKEHAAIILALGKEPEPGTLEKAIKEGLPVLTTDLPAFEIAGRIFTVTGMA